MRVHVYRCIPMHRNVGMSMIFRILGTVGYLTLTRMGTDMIV